VTKKEESYSEENEIELVFENDQRVRIDDCRESRPEKETGNDLEDHFACAQCLYIPTVLCRIIYVHDRLQS
jgi:hypothetical protein